MNPVRIPRERSLSEFTLRTLEGFEMTEKLMVYYLSCHSEQSEESFFEM